MKRAIRRHHRERLMKKRLTYWAASDGFEVRIPDPERAIRLVTTPCACSCPMCSNPRRHTGEVTRQEQLADLRFADELVELVHGEK